MSKQLLRETYNAKHPKRRKKAKRARQKLRTIGELHRKLPKESPPRHQEELQRFEKVLAQQRGDKDKLYSPHKPIPQKINGETGRRPSF